MFSQEKKIQLQKHKTPFYFYDLELLQKTLSVITTESKKYNYHVHYAFKANTNLIAIAITGTPLNTSKNSVITIKPAYNFAGLQRLLK